MYHKNPKSINLSNLTALQLREHFNALLYDNSDFLKIEKFFVTKCLISEPECSYLIPLLLRCPFLKSIFLVNNKLDIQCLIFLLKAINNQSIKSMTISDHWMNDSHFHEFAKILKTCTYLTSLELSLDWLQDLCITRLINALENIHLTSLNISCNDFQADGLDSIASFIKEHAIKNLDLSYNWINNCTIKSIAKSLHNNPHLQNLNLSSNQICDSGSHYVSNSLIENEYLLRLKLSDNQISIKGANRIIKSALEHKKLKELDLSYNNLDIKSINYLRKINESGKLELIL